MTKQYIPFDEVSVGVEFEAYSPKGVRCMRIAHFDAAFTPSSKLCVYHDVFRTLPINAVVIDPGGSNYRRGQAVCFRKDEAVLIERLSLAEAIATWED